MRDSSIARRLSPFAFVLDNDPHSNACDASNDLRLRRVVEPLHFLMRMRMRNHDRLSPVNLAPGPHDGLPSDPHTRVSVRNVMRSRPGPEQFLPAEEAEISWTAPPRVHTHHQGGTVRGRVSVEMYLLNGSVGELAAF
jgi:hypothetical protein